jgi:hypothetical protein
MPETLESPSCILLYGRIVNDLQIQNPPYALGPPPAYQVQPPRLGANLFLRDQLQAPGACIARIYGFAYEGHYYDLARPPLFLVHGPGHRADRLPEPPPDPLTNRRTSARPDKVDRFGVAATCESFPEDIRVWAYDKGDFSLRMDVRTGPLEQILLEPETSSDVLKTFFGGASARLRSPQGGGPD